MRHLYLLAAASTAGGAAVMHAHHHRNWWGLAIAAVAFGTAWVAQAFAKHPN